MTKITQEILEKLRGLRSSGYSIKELAKLLKISVTSASRYSKNIPISLEGLSRLEERSKRRFNNILLASIKEEVAALRDTGMTIEELTEAFPVSRKSIVKLIKSSM